jgi:hypothetical protein
MGRNYFKEAGLRKIGQCEIDTPAGKIDWPYYFRNGLWCLTAANYSKCGRPRYDRPWLSVTHMPTGLSGGWVKADDPGRERKLAMYAKVFGKATSLQGVMRKYRALSKARKRLITAQFLWNTGAI